MHATKKTLNDALTCMPRYRRKNAGHFFDREAIVMGEVLVTGPSPMPYVQLVYSRRVRYGKLYTPALAENYWFVTVTVTEALV